MHCDEGPHHKNMRSLRAIIQLRVLWLLVRAGRDYGPANGLDRGQVSRLSLPGLSPENQSRRTGAASQCPRAAFY